jgi:carbon-monoxide dehydrogenase medium subunit
LTGHCGEVPVGPLGDHFIGLFPIFHDAEEFIADPVVRNRGTIAGALCQADLAEDLTAVCTTLDASGVTRGKSGTKVVAMEEFHVGHHGVSRKS